MTRSFMVCQHEAAKSQLACAEVVSAKCRPGFAETSQRERPPKSLPVKLRHLSSGVVPRAAAVAGLLYLLVPSAFAQQDPGVRGGLQNTAGYLEYRGIPIPHPPVISPHPTTGATITTNELASFNEGINRAGQLESTCDSCADIPDGSPVVGVGELDPIFPQFHTNSNGLGARHNADQCFVCHAQPTLGGSGGFLVPNPGQGTPMLPENPLFRLVPLRFGKQNVVPSFEQQYGPIREVRFKFKPDGTPDGSVHQLLGGDGHHKGSDAHQLLLKATGFRVPTRGGQLVVPDSAPDAWAGPDRFHSGPRNYEPLQRHCEPAGGTWNCRPSQPQRQ
jgi:hypothetical protein